MTKIYLTQNGSGILFPVSPPEITEKSEQKVTTYETAEQGEILHIGRRRLRVWSWSSFFPVKALSWAVDQSMGGMEYVQAINAMRDKREPLRLVIPELGIAADVAVTAFSYSQKKGVDIHYSIELKEHRGWT